MNEAPGVVIYIYSSGPTAATVRISANKKTNNEVKAVEMIGEELHYPGNNEKKTQELVHISAEKTGKKTFKTQPDELYQKIQTFLETDKVALFKSKNY